MQEEVAVWKEAFGAERFDWTFAGDECGSVTSCTTDGLEKSLPFEGFASNRSAWRRSQQPHEVFKVINAPQACIRVKGILQSGNRVEESNFRAIAAGANLHGKKIVSNSHFIAVCGTFLVTGFTSDA